MGDNFQQIKTGIYDPCSSIISNFKLEVESSAYNACHYILNEKSIICRIAKIIPKKNWQFVTFWKRNSEGIIEPFYKTDQIDYYVVNVAF